MQKKIAAVIFSTRLMAVLFIVFAIAMAMGTFIESWYTTETARVLIYNSWWFEAIMILFVINFAGNIIRYDLHKREKWSSLLIHLSFVFILIGAGITRYISYEGVMPIREGETTNTFLSETTYLTAFLDGEINGEPRRRVIQKPVLLAPAVDNHVVINTDYNGQPIKIEVEKYIHGAKEGIVPSKDGKKYFKIVESGSGNRQEHFLQEGEVSNINNILFALNKPTDGAVNITIKDSTYKIKAPFEGSFMRMADQMQGKVVADSTQQLMLRSLYNVGGLRFVFPDPVITGKFDIMPIDKKTKGQPDAVKLKVTTKGESKEVNILGAKGISNPPKNVKLGGLDIYLNYGSKKLELPFSLKLDDFVANKYPGTENNPSPSYSSFKSKVQIIEDGKSRPYEIYMNHILENDGFRLFQSSFDPDEKGTVLSVNHDPWGTRVTYLGYFLLDFGLMLILFDRGSRFGKLKVMLEKVKAKKVKLMTLAAIFLLSATGFSQNSQKEEEAHAHFAASKAQIDSVLQANRIPPNEAAKFGRLVIQDAGGRMKPANTYSSELLRKLSREDTYEGMNADQVLVSMTENPAIWYNVPLIYVKTGNDSIRNILGVPHDKEYLAMTDFFDMQGNYKLSPFLEDAYRAGVPNQFQRDFMETDKKVNLFFSALQGKVLRIFPIPGDENNKWVSYPEVADSNLKGMDSVYTSKILPLYMQSLQQAKKSGDYTQADQLLSSITSYQKKFGSDVMPSERKINAEITYNKYNIFKSLFIWYLVAGVFMMFFVIVRIFKDSKAIRILIGVGAVSILILFILHTLGLAARWYISGHAPWSDAYESMIYVAWATMFFGLAFGRKSNLTLASTAFVASIILMIAHGNWTDPAIANLQPVLNSYWLMIHVSVIVASYGPFTLGMILGTVSLILMMATTKKNKKKMEINIREITIITEMALTVGLVMLTIGNFLGGQWANESWGRYWGWDPKETWALISIMVYAFVIHMRLVPGLRGKWTFNFMAVVAYSSVMMTYFGVNFYLAGMHSYASGDKVITPTFVYYTLAGVAILGAVSYWRYKANYKKEPKAKITEEGEV